MEGYSDTGILGYRTRKMKTNKIKGKERKLLGQLT